MKPISATRIDTVAVTQVLAIPSGNESVETLQVTAALWDTKSNDVVAIVEHGGIWSPKTLNALAALYASIESDIANHLARGTEEVEQELGSDATGTGGAGIFPEE
jgi:hypothetical protein